MNRREFMQWAGLTAVSTSVAQGVAAPATRPTTQPETAAPFGPMLTNVTPDGVTVTWGIGQPATGWVEFGETEQLDQRADGDVGGFLPYGQRVISIRLTGLAPGKKYYYRVHSAPVDFQSAYQIHRGPETAGATGSFTTLNPSAPEANFVVWNDTHEHHETILKLASIRGQADFLFWNGDIANDIAEEADIPTKYLNPAGGPSIADSTPVFFARGNHDVRGLGARVLDRYVSGPTGGFYHWFRQGPVAVVALDTGEDKPDSLPVYAGLTGFAAYREQQRLWLEKVIQEEAFRSAPFRVVFTHIPLVWEKPALASWKRIYGPHRGWVCDDGLNRWGKSLIDGRVNLVISGHTHNSAYYPATSTRPWSQLIGGGPFLRSATMIRCRATSTQMTITMTLADTGETLVNETFRSRV